MTRFSANLGLLWRDLSLSEAILAAARSGFDAVECHWPYDDSAPDVRAALHRTGLPMLSLNTARGGAGQFGLSALPGRANDACRAIDEAIGYARRIGAGSVHVMAGFARGTHAHGTFVENLRHAVAAGAAHGIGVLIEPINSHDAPGYFLQTTQQAVEILHEVAHDNLRLIFDCYHVARSEGDVLTRLEEAMPFIGHVQIASVPGRAEPDRGDLDYREVFARLETLGWDRPVGAEYNPAGDTAAGLGWMRSLQPG